MLESSSPSKARTGVRHVLFLELADSLHLWMERLYRRLNDEKVDRVYFLSREGQPLKRMFEAYGASVGSRINTSYLEVSRRATLLPSLKALHSETFETLFRQYRAISLLEFLSSLGLEDRLNSLELSLSLNNGESRMRMDDFPNSQIFAALRGNAEFKHLYETRRIAQRDVLINYLRDLSGGTLPSTMVVVDVGWKGTIQDNLHAMLCVDEDRVIEKIKGFYIGLVAAGSESPTNTKEGLLFSYIGGGTQGFHVFNENKSLFEVILAADHGSVVGYEYDHEGRPVPIRGAFEEGEMLKTSVFPLLYAIEKKMTENFSACGQPVKKGLPEVLSAHSRMVFNPSENELKWFDSIFHVENFGVFERSYFAEATSEPSFLSRLKFIARLARRRKVGELGFWPWATLYRRAGRIPAAAYGAIRRWQARRGMHG